MKRTMFKLAKYSVLGLMLASSNLYAAGYQLEFQSASTLADAGEAAAINDAGTNWYNPAGIVYLPHQVVYSFIDLYAPSTFTGSVTGGSAFGPAFNFNANGSSAARSNSLLPAFHYVYPFNDRVAVGLSTAPAWGFLENYGETSLLRYDVARVETKTFDFTPNIAIKLDDHWSIGAGPDIHYFYVKSKTMVFTEGAPPGFATPGDSTSKYSASNWGYGGHVGVLYRWNEGTRFGVNYRSKMTMNLEGKSGFQLDGVGYFETNLFQLKVPLPAVTTFSAYHEITPRIALLGTVAYDQWSVLNQYHARNYIQPPTPGNPSGILPNVIVPQDMHDTVDVSVGTHFKINDQFLLRGSIKYEPTPTSDKFRDVNFPDGRKLGLQIGARYQYSKKIALDVIYGHVFVKTAKIHGVYPQVIFPNTVAANGHSRTHIDLLGAQLVLNI